MNWTFGSKPEPPKFQPVGIIYARKDGSAIEVRVMYEAHVEQSIRDKITTTFGVSAILWEEK